MTPRIQQVLPVYPDFIRVQWTVEDKEGSCGSVDVLRAESPNGPYTVIEEGLEPSVYFYTDYDVELSGLSRTQYYIIRAVSIYGPHLTQLSEAKSYGYDHKDHRARIARKARRDLKVTLERLNGVKLAIVKKKTFGPRCEYCYNPATKDTLVSNCPKCYGTSFSGGYHDPVYLWGKLDPAPVQSSLGTSGKIETAITGLTIIDYPVVSPDDLVVELQTNRRFKVQRVMKSESSRVLVHQDLQVSELSRSSPEYSVPVDLNYEEF